MDNLELMTNLNLQLNIKFQNRLTILQHATTNVIHVYNKSGEIARLELLRGSEGNMFIHQSDPNRRFASHNIKVEHGTVS